MVIKDLADMSSSECLRLLVRGSLLWTVADKLINTLNFRRGQRTNQKYRNLVGANQQMQKAHCIRTVGVNCYIISNVS